MPGCFSTLSETVEHWHASTLTACPYVNAIFACMNDIVFPLKVALNLPDLVSMSRETLELGVDMLRLNTMASDEADLDIQIQAVLVSVVHACM